jgi:hypothetical protein
MKTVGASKTLTSIKLHVVITQRSLILIIIHLNAIFGDVAPCSSCVNRRFGGMYRLQLQSHLLTLVPRSRIFLP